MAKELNLADLYREGQSYDLPESDYEALLKIGLCDPVAAHAVASPAPAKAKKVQQEETK